jgi:hypothetical protein
MVIVIIVGMEHAPFFFIKKLMVSTSATHPTLSIYDKEDDIETMSQTKTIIESQETSNVEVDATWVLLKPYFLSKKHFAILC